VNRLSLPPPSSPQKQDPYGSGEIPAAKLDELVRELGKPLGVDNTSSRLEVERYIKKGLFAVGFTEGDLAGPVADFHFDITFSQTIIALHYLVLFGDNILEVFRSSLTRTRSHSHACQ
jgi:hypothetical protein